MKLWLLLMIIFACIGIVETMSRLLVYLAGRRVFCGRIFYVDGEDWHNQQGAIYSFYQWSSHKEGGVWILADATDNTAASCSLKELANELDMIYCSAGEFENSYKFR